MDDWTWPKIKNIINIYLRKLKHWKNKWNEWIIYFQFITAFRVSWIKMFAIYLSEALSTIKPKITIIVNFWYILDLRVEVEIERKADLNSILKCQLSLTLKKTFFSRIRVFHRSLLWYDLFSHFYNEMKHEEYGDCHE